MDKEALPSHVNPEKIKNSPDGQGNPGIDEVSAGRRKLIKASAAAVPAVMTLRSGAAAAMASTYHCTARANKLAKLEIVEPADYVLEGNDLPHDHWIRVAGKRVRQATNKPPFYCTLTGDGDGLNAWQCFDEEGTLLVDGEPSWPSWLNENAIDRGDDVALLAFLNFNEHGDDKPFEDGAQIKYYPIIQTVTEAPGGPSPLTGSCLSSIHPNLLNGDLG